MKLLFIEDNDIKARLVIRWLNDNLQDATVVRKRSYQSGLREALSGGYDHILLDMSLPVYDEKSGVMGRDPLTFGGQYLLREMKRKKAEANVVVISQYKTFLQGNEVVTFEQLREELLRDFSTLLKACIYLKSSSTWKSELETYFGLNDENFNS